MILKNTDDLIKQKLGDELSTYVAMVGVNGKEAVISSPGANIDTYFDIASMGKVLVTSTLALKAAGKGMLTLDDTIDKYFNGVPEEKRKITIRQLLLHTSGIKRREIPKDIVLHGMDAIAEYILSFPLEFDPGAGYIYSCTGYILLGFILELSYNLRLDKIFITEIKTPLELTRSKFNIEIDEDNAAVCHYRSEAGLCMAADSIVYNMDGVGGNGASFWTAGDLKKYITAVLNKSDKLYPQEYYSIAEQNHTPDFEDGRGLGYLIVNERYKQTGRLFPIGSFGHTGNTGTSFFMNRERSMYVILLTNATRHSYMKNDYKYCKYNDVKDMREQIHNAILSDLTEQGIL